MDHNKQNPTGSNAGNTQKQNQQKPGQGMPSGKGDLGRTGGNQQRPGNTTGSTGGSSDWTKK